MQPQPAKKIRQLTFQKSDDRLWWFFDRYCYGTSKQITRAIQGKFPHERILFDTIQIRLRGLHENKDAIQYVGRVQVNTRDSFLYFLREPGARQAVERGMMETFRCVQKKSASQIPHEQGITDAVIRIDEQFPGADVMRWRGQLEERYPYEVPDFVVDLHDGMDDTPWEWIRENPIDDAKLRYYRNNFRRSYIILPAEMSVTNKLKKLPLDLQVSNIWFSSHDQVKNDIKGPIWRGGNGHVYSILKPENYT